MGGVRWLVYLSSVLFACVEVLSMTTMVIIDEAEDSGKMKTDGEEGGGGNKGVDGVLPLSGLHSGTTSPRIPSRHGILSIVMLEVLKTSGLRWHVRRTLPAMVSV
ncbi:hypothetical protein BDQ17DRAFT_753628 [Cyathus striatus]|nr:hypothetical protein BDQ17DRAFT_753628 [Cyathus striatus]